MPTGRRGTYILAQVRPANFYHPFCFDAAFPLRADRPPGILHIRASSPCENFLLYEAAPLRADRPPGAPRHIAALRGLVLREVSILSVPARFSFSFPRVNEYHSFVLPLPLLLEQGP